MIVLPAIDLKDGKCVRLEKGDFSTARQVADDALETAGRFLAAGAKMIHMVDLDGALDGVRKNAEIVAAVASRIKVELGGGLRTMADLDAADHLGIHRMVIGSAAVSAPDFVREAVKRYGPRIAVGIDARNGIVSTHGWTQESGLNALEFAVRMEDSGVQTLIYTDIETDGMLSGPNLHELAALRNRLTCGIIASGGVRDEADIRRLRALGMDGVIIGKACYAGTLDLAAVISEVNAC